jgi:hypothetical protein
VHVTEVISEEALAPSGRRRRIIRAACLVVLLFLLLAGYELAQAAHTARNGRADLDSAASALHTRDVKAAEAALRRASSDFDAADRHLSRMGPVGWLAQATPLVRIQLRATHALVDAGQQVSRAGVRAMPLAADLLDPPAGQRTLATVTTEAQQLAPELDRAAAEVASANKRLAAYDGYRLLWPLAGQWRAARTRMTAAETQATRAQHALRVGLEVAGADGPRRFLILSQNPDEVRPTGGYMGTYGVLVSDRGRLELERYGAMGAWTNAHPAAEILPAQAPFQFRWADPPQPQTLANVNTTPDWPTSARLAAELWQRGGEKPVDGVLTFTPALLTRLIAALGSVRVADYPDVVTAVNVAELLEHYTHREAVRGLDTTVRKEFIAHLAQAVLQTAVNAPAVKLPNLAEAFGAGLDSQEAALWLTASSRHADLAALGWEGAFQSRAGDYFADAEFAFVSKNGRGLRRTFDHRVTLNPDGSGTSQTVLTIRNTLPFEGGDYNDNPIYYLTPYGPRGGALGSASDEPDSDQPPLLGHPSAGWLRTVPALSSASLKVAWDAPNLALERSDGRWEYRLTWIPTAGHSGDTLLLHVALPPGWRWQQSSPPAEVRLDRPMVEKWIIMTQSK